MKNTMPSILLVTQKRVVTQNHVASTLHPIDCKSSLFSSARFSKKLYLTKGTTISSEWVFLRQKRLFEILVVAMFNSTFLSNITSGLQVENKQINGTMQLCGFIVFLPIQILLTNKVYMRNFHMKLFHFFRYSVVKVNVYWAIVTALDKNNHPPSHILTLKQSTNKF